MRGVTVRVDRRRRRHDPRAARAHLRPVLHDQGRRHRPRPSPQPADRGSARRRSSAARARKGRAPCSSSGSRLSQGRRQARDRAHAARTTKHDFPRSRRVINAVRETTAAAPTRCARSTIETGVQRNPEGSVRDRVGGTKVLIAASVQEGVKDFLRGTGKGWVTAEYAMHPRANPERQKREGAQRPSAAARQEIQRLIGRALRAAVASRGSASARSTSTATCSTPTAARAPRRSPAASSRSCSRSTACASAACSPHGVLREPVAAVSVGLSQGSALLDLCYDEDRDCQVDLNLVATDERRHHRGAGHRRGRADDARRARRAGRSRPRRHRARSSRCSTPALERAGVDLARLLDAMTAHVAQAPARHPQPRQGPRVPRARSPTCRASSCSTLDEVAGRARGRRGRRHLRSQRHQEGARDRPRHRHARARRRQRPRGRRARGPPRRLLGALRRRTARATPTTTRS